MVVISSNRNSHLWFSYIDFKSGLYVLVKAPVRVLHGKYSMKGGVKKLMQHEA